MLFRSLWGNGPGLVYFYGVAGTATISTNGNLIAGGSYGGGTLSVFATSGGGYTTLQFSNLVRNGRATLNLGTTTGNYGVSNRILFIGNGSNLVNTLLPVWMQVAADFLTYGANGVTNATYAATFTSSLTTQVVNNTATATIANGGQQVYALKLGANIDLNGNNLTIGDGTTAGMIFVNT